MLQRRRIIFLLFCAIVCGPHVATAATRPVVSFIKANIGDSARSVRERAFDVLLRDAVNKSACLSYVNTAARDSLARERAIAKEPFTFREMRSDLGVRYGVYFALDRYGYMLRLASKVVDEQGVVVERTDLDLLQAADTLDNRNPYEAALRRALDRVTAALAIASDSTCPARVAPVLPVLVGAVLVNKMEKGFGMFLSDNATSISNVALARMSDSLRYERKYMVIDITSRDALYARLGEFGIQNTVMPSTQEVALMNAVGLPVYLVAVIDSADAFRKLRVTVHAYATANTSAAPLASFDRVVEPELEVMYGALNELAYQTADKVMELIK